MTDRLSLANALAEAKIVATKSDLQATRTELKADIAELELRLKAEIDRVVTRLGALVLALTGVILAAIRYLPPAH